MKKIKLFVIIAVVFVLSCSAIVVGVSKSKVKANDKENAFTNPKFMSNVSIDTISKEQTESLYKLCKIWGIVKYYHPTVVRGEVDWDLELFKMIPKVMNSSNQEETNSILLEWVTQYSFDNVLPEEEFSEEEYDEFIKKITIENNDMGWNGFMLDLSWIKDTSYWGEDLCKYLVRLSHICIEDRSKSAAYLDETGFINFENEKKYDINPQDDGMKLLALFRYWNIYEYFSPNITITKKDWNEVLIDAIPKMISVDTYKDYILAIADVASETGDAHTRVDSKGKIIESYYGEYFLPCSYKVIDDQIVVEGVSESEKKQGLKPGDIITEIDGITMKERVNTLKRYCVVSEENKYAHKISISVLRTKEEKALVKVIRDNKEINLNVTTSKYFYQYKNPFKNGLMNNRRIGYIDPSALNDGDVEKLMEKFEHTKGIIVDLRKYPNVELPRLLAEYITPEQIPFVKLGRTHPLLPGCFYYDIGYSGAGTLSQFGDNRIFPKYKGKVILLMNETSISNSEFTVMSLRKAPNALVLGSPSIGADGDVVEFELPGEVSLGISSIGVYTPEGEQTQRVGLKPDVECYPTVKGLQEGRDELIEKATELILTK